MRGISIADWTLVGCPCRSSASCSASAFITVPSMPMWSLCVASMPSIAPVRPRQKLPPPTTTATSTSRFWRMSVISAAVWSSVGPSSPRPLGPASASPDGLETIGFHRGRSVTTRESARHRFAVGYLRNEDPDWGSADFDLGEANDAGVAQDLLDRLLVVLGVGLLEQADVLEEAVEAAL